MKKLAQCAVLLAFALAFVGCNTQDEPEGTPTLQDVLNNNEEVDLDEYNPLAFETYTISKNKVIKGNAKGANFAIADGVSVTFDDTKNIGTVTVGTANRAATVRAAQNTNGATITLKGDGVTIDKVFIYVENCTLNSESTDNSFKNVVVASTVKTLALEGNTKVSTLVSSSGTTPASITITVTTDVKIEKADSTIKKAVEESNPTVANKIGNVTDEELKGLQNAFEEESKKEPTGSNKFITTKEELVKCVENIIDKYYDFACEIEDRNRNSQNRAATATKDDISNQLKAAFDAVFVPFLKDDNEELRKSFINLFTGENVTTDINFEGEINLKNITVNKGVDAFIDFANYAQDYFPSDEDDEVSAPGSRTTSKQITRKTLFGSNYYKVNDFLDIADKYASVPKLYLLGKLDVKAAATGNADYASATAKANLEIEATDINGMIPELFKAYNNDIGHTYVPASVNLPVTAVKPFYDIDANVVLTKNQYDNFITTLKKMPEDDCDDFWNSYPSYTGSWSDYEAVNKYYDDREKAHDAYHENARKEIKEYLSKASFDNKSFSYKINYGISTTVTNSKDVPGGIITVSLNVAHNNPKKVLTLMATGVSGSDYVEVLKELEKDFDIKPTITVTDYNGKQTYSLSGIDNIISVIEDVVKHIGDIIQ